jgi:hypothetical protein
MSTRVGQFVLACSCDFIRAVQKLGCLCTRKAWQVETRRSPEAPSSGSRVPQVGKGRSRQTCLESHGHLLANADRLDAGNPANPWASANFRVAIRPDPPGAKSEVTPFEPATRLNLSNFQVRRDWSAIVRVLRVGEVLRTFSEQIPPDTCDGSHEARGLTLAAPGMSLN